MATPAVRQTAALAMRRNSSEPTPMNRESYPPARATEAAHSSGRAQVKTRYSMGCEPWLTNRAWIAITPATTPQAKSPIAARHR